MTILSIISRGSVVTMSPRFNFVEEAHLQQAGIDTTRLLLELPSEVVRQLHYDILKPELQFDVTYRLDQKMLVNYFNHIKQNPLTKQLLESLSLLYASAQQRGWNLPDSIDEGYMQLANPTDSDQNLWHYRATLFLQAVYTASHSTKRIGIHNRRFSYISSWLNKHFDEEVEWSKTVNQLTTANAMVFSILLAEPAMPKRSRRKWRKLKIEAQQIAKDIIQYEQATRVN